MFTHYFCNNDKLSDLPLDDGNVKYNISQDLSSEQKTQARQNIGAIGTQDITLEGDVEITPTTSDNGSLKVITGDAYESTTIRAGEILSSIDLELKSETGKTTLTDNELQLGSAATTLSIGTPTNRVRVEVDGTTFKIYASSVAIRNRLTDALLALNVANGTSNTHAVTKYQLDRALGASASSTGDVALSGTPTAPTPGAESAPEQIATKGYVDSITPTGVRRYLHTVMCKLEDEGASNWRTVWLKIINSSSTPLTSSTITADGLITGVGVPDGQADPDRTLMLAGLSNNAQGNKIFTFFDVNSTWHYDQTAEPYFTDSVEEV